VCEDDKYDEEEEEGEDGGDEGNEEDEAALSELTRRLFLMLACGAIFADCLTSLSPWAAWNCLASLTYVRRYLYVLQMKGGA